MPVPTKKTNPIWLAQQDIEGKYARTIKYYKNLYQAWPEWSDYEKEFKAINAEQLRLKKKGTIVEIDHIIPLCSDYVCGLHVPWNLKLVTPAQNLLKSNKYWPDMWNIQIDMFSEFKPYQMELIK